MEEKPAVCKRLNALIRLLRKAKQMIEIGLKANYIVIANFRNILADTFGAQVFVTLKLCNARWLI
ncbi:hypothetical protein [Mucilaginibacter terrenus]|uniref:hypothetical protein n=1 Tax=Mucilaginibacter terrenus TaxID=2482727 RepID=UPI00105893CC|nr:hypothetical protein [Mucilaginibacter terrenus]